MPDPSSGPPTTEWPIEELSDRHDRSAFDCGHESLTEYLRKFAGQNQKSGVSRTYVATHPGDPVVMGYYALAAGAVAFENLQDDQRRRLPRYPVPVAHLGRLAVDRGSQGCGLGELLLIDALRRTQAAAEHLGIHAIEVVAIDDAAARFYRRYGFTPLRDDPHHLYISLKMVRKLGLL